MLITRGKQSGFAALRLRVYTRDSHPITLQIFRNIIKLYTYYIIIQKQEIIEYLAPIRINLKELHKFYHW